MAFFINSLNLSIISEFKLSDPFNISAFNIIIYITAGNLTNEKAVED
jgi:hypothetical protein